MEGGGTLLYTAPRGTFKSSHSRKMLFTETAFLFESEHRFESRSPRELNPFSVLITEHFKALRIFFFSEKKNGKKKSVCSVWALLLLLLLLLLLPPPPPPPSPQ